MVIVFLSTGMRLNVNVDSNKEIPQGNVDGYNFIFTISQTPVEDSEHVWINGLLQKSGEDFDYTIYKNVIYLIEPPFEGSAIVCTYKSRKAIDKQNEVAKKISNRFYSTEDEIEKGNEMVYLNGLLQIEGENQDYVIDSNIIKFNQDLLNTDIVIITYSSK